ncbi:SMP-30/gluconolactonase/LRE family protein [Pseudonocardia sp. KRD-184]|uniref:SMP-30/gluconolactonase/LRE family protein n=1 Tax=Pseudonocardia oceani TaxID=2792013 RepID=A0ABS6U3H3_9PSEU|nr:SMP-30/gluconolactonase/LRE family protein [Pseudonocardia oceani]MBW0092006.1 SMP-30/gluconolactonase/LRE family protein [Pseudonocardia oceani]MBW0099605.1 SMP-30/gluconolactonase/LRE family protein [Pseudonocardia oceani]MBW0112336.1 SMP-30/gluconolactonase/LRE family protein [Pseudonocardia oceani]MBW0123956.1 SMP-30/gluconolactonase/LRE family protein [Pseudonocardia oceani]MBW0126787.1 SMP-30/gluconolactonase/LRE family protein [Pseudonocardia oceani]
MTIATPASDEVCTLGEGPVWDAPRERLLWVDIVGGAVLEGRIDGDAVHVTGRHAFDSTVGAVALRADGGLLVAERQVLTSVEPDGRRTEVARVLPAGRRSRLNDGAVDPGGRFLVGSLAQDDRTGEEVLVRLEGDAVVPLDTDLDLSNGLAWSPAGDRLYSIDTIPGTIWQRDYDPETGAVGERRVLCTVEGSPDGMCVDADGRLWIALYDGGRVECRTPDGEVAGHVELDAPHPTCVAFAGPDLDLLVITTARQGMSDDELAAHPDSGRLHVARPGARGLPTSYWEPAGRGGMGA